MLNLNISSIEGAEGAQHNGVVRIHFDHYIGHGAQTKLEELAASNKDINSIILQCEQQKLVIEAAVPTSDFEELKKMATGFMKAVKEWYENLDSATRDEYTYHPNPARDAARAYAKGSMETAVR